MCKSNPKCDSTELASKTSPSKVEKKTKIRSNRQSFHSNCFQLTSSLRHTFAWCSWRFTKICAVLTLFCLVLSSSASKEVMTPWPDKINKKEVMGNIFFPPSKYPLTDKSKNIFINRHVRLTTVCTWLLVFFYNTSERMAFSFQSIMLPYRAKRSLTSKNANKKSQHRRLNNNFTQTAIV